MIERVGILGFGNMGEALAHGLLGANPSVKLAVLEKQPDRRARAAEIGAAVFAEGEMQPFLAGAPTVVLAVKPQDLLQLGEGGRLKLAGHQVVSILAGTTIARLQQQLETNTVARLMPSLAATVRRAVVGVALPPNAPQALRQAALQIASAMGSVQEIPERLMSAVTGLSGSGLAYVFAFIHALALGGTRAGIPYPQALEIAREVTAGAAELLASGGEHPISALSRVISPAGTTIEGVTALERSAFSAAVIEAVSAAAERAADLEQ